MQPDLLSQENADFRTAGGADAARAILRGFLDGPASLVDILVAWTVIVSENAVVFDGPRCATKHRRND
jgi:hypothetical protein